MSGTRVMGSAVLGLLLLGCTASPPPGSRAPRSTKEPAPAIALDFLPGRIVFSSFRQASDGSSAIDIYAAKANGERLVRLTIGPEAEFDPAWSPDGEKIAYRVEPPDSNGGGSDIWVMEADGSNKTNLTRDGNGNWSPDWSPDGKRIAFASGGSDQRQHIFVMNSDGTGRRQVEGSVEGEYPAWSPDGRKIAFMSMQPGASGSNPDFDVFVMDADGSHLTRLTASSGSDGIPAWSPDGVRIAFQSGRDDCGISDREDCGNSGDIGPFHDLYVMRADGSEETRLIAGQGYYPTWSPDGRYIMFSAGSLFVMDARIRVPVRLPIASVGEIDFADWTE